VVAVAFLAGVLIFNFVRYQPLNERLNQTQTELTQSNQNVRNLEAKLATASNKVTALENDNQALQSELDTATTHLELLQALVDINNARLALVDGDLPAAKVSLENTSTKLEVLAPRIAEVDTNLAQSMPQRLALILAGLDSNIENAKVDLELLTGNLLDVEAALFDE
jgi:chromosome segregation ATPase